mmetsp:Transcript_15768/g.37278  ORF Transcript_15768/g.37278 Transcript_15768/m.37278 type:complete len:1920 (+) Transcript_15768:72-5831(+)
MVGQTGGQKTGRSNSGAGKRGDGKVVLPRDTRKRLFGLDCPSELVWHGWSPGGDLKKSLVIKNVSTEVVSFKFKLPENKFFFMNFPEVVRLSPGMSCSVDVHFRPIKSEMYDDVIEFISPSGSFFIRVLATLPNYGLTLQEMLDFGFCPIMENTTRTFVITNTGEVPADFSLKCKAPFKVVPARGTLEPKSQREVNCIFTPQDASVYVATVVCHRAEGEPLYLKVSGIGKIPFLNCDTPVMDFGEVLTGTTATQTFSLRNTALVPANFTIRALETGHDATMAIHPTAGTVPPDGKMMFSVAYSPAATGAFSSEHFEVSTPGGNKLILHMMGTSLVHRVHLEPRSVNFGDVALGNKSAKTIFLKNATNAPAKFVFMTDPNSAFQFSRKEGIIPAQSQVFVDLRFTPQDPINYYKRIFCLVQNQRPLYADVLGTSYDAKRRPAPFKQRHVDAYRQSRRPKTVAAPTPQIPVGRYLGASSSMSGAMSPEEMLDSLQFDVTAETGLALESMPSAADLQALAGPPPDDRDVHGVSEAEAWEEFFLEMSDRSRPVYLGDEQLDFGSSSPFSLGETKSVSLTNNTNNKVSVVWMLPPDPNSPTGEPCLKVFPSSQDIAAHTTANFRVSFRPTMNNQYYCQVAEAIIFPKTQRNFRLVKDETFVPPFTVALRITGHTFGPGAEHFSARVSMSHSKVVFTQCAPRERGYQVVLLENKGDTNVVFNFETDSKNTFRARPRSGIILPHGTNLVAFEFYPTEPRRYTTTLKCVFNHSAASTIELVLTGVCSVPALQLPCDDLFIKPTCVGAESVRQIEVTNPSGVAVLFKWEIPEHYSRVLRVEPAVGVLRGNESMTLSWFFCPRKPKAHSFRIGCSLQHANASGTAATVARGRRGEEAQRVMLNVFAEGTAGQVMFSPSVIDFGVMLVGTVTKRTVNLCNKSDCSMQYQLSFYEDNQGMVPSGPPMQRTAADRAKAKANADKGKGNTEELTTATNEIVDFDRKSGILPAFSSQMITISFKPRRREYSSVQIIAALGTGNPEGDMLMRSLLLTPDEHSPRCNMVCNVVYPTLAFVDARCDGLSTSRIFRELSLVQLNTALSADLTQREYDFNNGDIDETDPEKVLDQFQFNFRVKEVGSDPSVFRCLIKNTGVLPLSFAFKFPKDDEDEPENWVDTDLLSAAEVTRNQILENKLFAVQPRVQTLQAGASCEVQFAFLHLFASRTFKLPVILKIQDGKQVVLQLTGHTLAVGETCLTLPVPRPPFSAGEFALRSVPIGSLEPPVQYLQLYNDGVVPLEWAADLAAIHELYVANYSFPVLELLDEDSGTIEPQTSIFLRWVFKPLAAKPLAAVVPIVVVAGEAHSLTIRGSGFQASPEPDFEEEILPLPLSQVLVPPAQRARISVERLLLGNIAVGAVCHRFLVVSNLMHDRECRFTWDLSSSLASEIVTITPVSGTIAPGSLETFRVSVLCMQPSAFDFDVPLIVEELDPDAGQDDEENLDDETEGDSPKKMTEQQKLDQRKLSSRAGSLAPGQGTQSIGQYGQGMVTQTMGSGSGTEAERTGTADSRRPRGNKLKNRPSVVGRTIGNLKKNSALLHQLQMQQAAAQAARGGGVRFSHGTKLEHNKEHRGSNASLASIANVGQSDKAPAQDSVLSLRSSMPESHTGQSSGVHFAEPEPETEQLLYISIQGYARRPEVHREIFGNLDDFVIKKHVKEPNVGESSKARGSTPRTSQHSLTPQLTPNSSRRPSMLNSSVSQAEVAQASIVDQEAVQRAVMGDIMDKLLTDLCGDQTVTDVFAELQIEPTPYYIQMCNRPPTPYRMPEPGEARAAPSGSIGWSSDVTQGGAAPPTQIPGAGAGAGAPGGAADIGWAFSGASAPSVDGGITQGQRDKERALRVALATPEVQNLVHFVLDACIFNMLSEALFGEEDLF